MSGLELQESKPKPDSKTESDPPAELTTRSTAVSKLPCHINRLPPEILITVLEAREEEKDLITATHVCSEWRKTLVSTPYLWTKIDFINPELAKCYLERSQLAPIDVTVRGLTKAILIPTPWVARMKSLHIQADQQDIVRIVRRLCRDTPNLQSLEIHRQGSGVDPAVDFPRNFLGNAPSLRDLAFRSVSSAIPAFSVPNLTCIDWRTTTSVKFEQLLEFFESSPLLEVIKMQVPVVRTSTDRPLNKVILGNLRKLSWTDRAGPISLMPYITAPKLSRLKIAITRDPEDHPTRLSSILPNRVDIPLLSEPTTLVYNCSFTDRMYSFGYPEPAHALLRVSDTTGLGRNSVGTTTFDDWFSRGNTPISFSKIQKLEVTSCQGSMSPAYYPIWRFESLDELCLEGDLYTFLQLLKFRRGEPVPCPALSTIRITPSDCRFALRELREVLEQRREAGYQVKTVHVRIPEIEELSKVVPNLVIQSGGDLDLAASC
jgi:hypothetical protein